MRLLHPIMPFITEEVWQIIAPILGIQGKSIMVASYPAVDRKQVDTPFVIAESKIRYINSLITTIRNMRGEMNVSPAKKITVILNQGSLQDYSYIEECEHYILSLAKIEKITWHDPKSKMPECSTALLENLEIHIPLAGLIDRHAELARLKKEIEKIEKMKAQTEARLNNPTFVEKAPENVVVEVREQLKNQSVTLKTLHEQSIKIEALANE